MRYKLKLYTYNYFCTIYFYHKLQRSYRYLISEAANIPEYSGKQTVRCDFLIFSSNRSFLFRKRIMDVSVNHLLLQMESNSLRLSCIRFCRNSKTKQSENMKAKGTDKRKD